MQVRTFSADVTVAEAQCPAAVSPRAGNVLGLRHAVDGWLILGTLAFVAVVLTLPNPLVIGIGIWWLLNTVSHNFIHQPFFRSRGANLLFAVFLSVLTLVPQRLWRDKHLAHHADRAWRLGISSELCVQSVLVALLWSAAFMSNPGFVLAALAPGFSLAMALCALHGYFEHVTGTTSHYSCIYNRLFFNDGFHVEHHEHPGLHWAALPRIRRDSQASQWPAVLRWCDWLNLNGLETLVTRCPMLQRWVIAAHEKAIRNLSTNRPQPKHIVIIGGGLFPRTALVAHAIWPAADVTIIDSNALHLEMCRRWLRGDETLLCQRVTSDSLPDADLIFVPLAFDQDKGPIYESAQNRCVILHDWIWTSRTNRVVQSVITSVFLLKRLNLVMQ